MKIIIVSFTRDKSNRPLKKSNRSRRDNERDENGDREEKALYKLFKLKLSLLILTKDARIRL